MNFTARDHTFVICAYKESPYLDECIQSLQNQTLKSNIIMTTSTQNTFIEGIAKKYNIPLYINRSDAGIAQDWNFGYSQAKTSLVTITHQDDTYENTYVQKALQFINREKKPLIFFTDYCEIREGQKIRDNKLLKIKRLMLIPIRLRFFYKSIWMRRRILSFGSPICCPSVTYVKNSLPYPLFEVKFKSDVDWQLWEKISKLNGSFVYCTEQLTNHRIHYESTTTQVINETGRSSEDYEMFRKFWPSKVADMLIRFYSKSEDINGFK